LGLTPRTRDQADGRRFPYVLFAAPPSGSDDYPAEVAAAARMWDGSGSMVFTSSMSVCAAEDGSEVSDENCPLVPEGKSPSTDRLLVAEQATLAAGGNVVRLVGLYHAQRGPHTFFIRQGEVARYGGYVVNMLHYEDAAGLAVAVLRGDGASAAQGGRWKEHIFVGTDGHPLTFQEMVDACFASGVFSGSVKFTAPEPPAGSGRGKRVKNDLTRKLLNDWTPKYSSFAGFFQETKGKDFYTTSGLF
jgi:nucleoside-diphosphate-sugar epimerase